MEAGLRYLLPSEVLLFVLLLLLLPPPLPESPPLLLEELPEDFSELPELAGAPEPALLLPLLSLLAEAESELPSDFAVDEEAGAGLLRA
jgi:hypothetical protein